MGLTLKDFVKKVLIGEIKTIQQTYGHHYLSFGLIAQGIELLGACLDNKDFHKNGTSGDRFRDAIDKLFPDKYKIFNNKTSDYDLYKNLRCGLLHVVLPGSFIELIQESEKEKFNAGHLDIKQIRGKDRLILVSQDLFSDFENACNEIVNRIDLGTIDPSKISGTLIDVEP
jgi:hypothetical protein